MRHKREALILGLKLTLRLAPRRVTPRQPPHHAKAIAQLRPGDDHDAMVRSYACSISARTAAMVCISTTDVFPTALASDRAPQTGQDDEPPPIVGGETVPSCSWPTSVDVAGCTGSLVHPRLVITAHHCRSNTRPLFDFGNVRKRPHAVSTRCNDCDSNATLVAPHDRLSR